MSESLIKRGTRAGLTLDALEARLMFYAATGLSWPSTDISYSYMPDGTQLLGGYTSSLFATLAPTAPVDAWQREIARALATWAQYAPINFHLVADDGTAQATNGLIQGDPNFGDIRLGARPAPTNVLGVTDFPTNGSTAAGDIRLNSSRAYYIGASPDLFSLVLHESGHALGLDHSTAGTVMYGAYSGILTDLTADDIAGIQAIYGVRMADAWDAAGSNNSLASASALTLNSGALAFRADLTSRDDVDFYRVVAPSSFDGTLSLSVDARGLSTLAPKVMVYDAAGHLVASAVADYGGVATLNLGGLVPGATYTFVADGASTDVFGMGAYNLRATFGGVTPDPVVLPPPSPPPPPPPPPAPPLLADRFELNDTAAAATSLGSANSASQSALNLNTSSDVDYFLFTPSSKGTFRVSIQFKSANGNLDLFVYDSQQRLLGSGTSSADNESINLALAAGQRYYLKVISPAGATNSYDLSVTKTSGSTKLRSGAALVMAPKHQRRLEVRRAGADLS